MNENENAIYTFDYTHDLHTDQEFQKAFILTRTANLIASCLVILITLWNTKNIILFGGFFSQIQWIFSITFGITSLIVWIRDRNGNIHYDVADMTVYRPDRKFDLVTCTGDAVNHIAELSDVEKIFENVYAYTAEGGYFVFDLLNENEVSDSEPFEMDFTDTMKVWFQMTRPAENKVNLCIRVFAAGKDTFEENIRETIHDPLTICHLLKKCGFSSVTCSDRLLSDAENHSTTWFVVAGK